MESFIRDVLFAFRSLRRQPAFAITAVLTIALGIGATTAIFSVVNAVLLRPLPYNDAARLGTVWSDLRNRNVVDFPLPPGDFYDMRKDTTQFDGFAAITRFVRRSAATAGAMPNRCRRGAVTTNFFTLLGHRIQVGRDFVEEDGTPQPAPPQGDALPPPGAATAAAAAEHRDPQPRVLAAPLRRRRIDRRQVDRVRQRPRRDRRRARAGIRAAVSARHQRRSPSRHPGRQPRQLRDRFAQQRLPARRGEAEAGRQLRAGAVGARSALRRSAIALPDQADLEHEPAHRADARGPGRRRAAAARRADGRGDLRAADRLRERRQPAAGPRLGARA